MSVTFSANSCVLQLINTFFARKPYLSLSEFSFNNLSFYGAPYAEGAGYQQTLSKSKFKLCKKLHFFKSHEMEVYKESKKNAVCASIQTIGRRKKNCQNPFPAI